MSARVRRDGAWLRKALTATQAQSGHRIAERAAILAAHGVRTPHASYDAQAQEIIFPWIAGSSGRDMLRRHFRRDEGWSTVPEALFAACLHPLARLHKVNPKAVDLAFLDPWHRIDPRLQALEDSATAERASLCRLARAAHRAAQRCLAAAGSKASPAQWVPVHGDYHVGQILFPIPAGEPWLIDLDDVALAPRESDLGNFAAHLATAEDFPAGGVLDSLQKLGALLCPLYEASASIQIDRDRVAAYGAVSLLRRALKLRERGVEETFVREILTAARILAEERPALPGPPVEL